MHVTLIFNSFCYGTFLYINNAHPFASQIIPIATMPPLLFFLLSSFLFLFLYSCRFLFRKESSKWAKGPRLPPGPKGWPILGSLPHLGPKPHHTLHSFAETYGPILHLRLGSTNVVVASSADIAAQFLRGHGANFGNRPPSAGAEHIAYNYHDMVFAPYGPRWRMIRRLAAQHLLGPKALEDLRHIREEELSVLVHTLHARSQGREPVKLGAEVHTCSTNALARAMTGRRVFVGELEGGGERERRNAEEFRELVVELMELAGQFVVGDFVPWLKWLDVGGVVKRMKRVHRRYDEFLDGLIEECGVEGEKGRNDLLSVLVGLKGEGDGDGGNVSDTHIKALLLNLLSAGTDTSSSTIEWAMTELIRHPDILKKAQQEIDSVVGREQLVSESDIPKLTFFQALIKENFRLHPPTPLSLPRLASEECVVDGYRVPKHSTLYVNVWAMGRDPKVWPNPLEFSPARFLPGGEGVHIDVRGHNFELIPFGSGRRICAGTSMGIRTVQSTVATLIHAFDWALPEGHMASMLDMEEAFGISLQKATPLMVHPVPRLTHKAYGAMGFII